MNFARWRHPIVVQWAWLVGLLLAATLLANSYALFWRLDLALYDAALPTGPAPGDVVIVAVDDASVAEIGRWPWRRALHAALLDRLRAMGARAVAMDFLFTEPDQISSEGDAALAAAMTRGPPTVLPLLVEMPEPGRPMRERLPIPMLLQAAADVGHAHLELDRDGIARSVYLREGIGAPKWPHFALALLASVPGAAPPRLPGARHPDLAGAGAVWVRDYQMLIPFLGPPGHFRQLSYVDVLRGDVGESAVRGKWVLVGTTAQGIGDAYPTPRSGEGRAMSGVEITANVLQALRSGTQIQRLTGWATSVLALIPVALAAAGLLLLAPRHSLIFVAALWLGTLGGSVLALREAGWWYAPSASLSALLVIYPLWSWRRLEATQAYLEEEFTRLASERFPLLGQLPSVAATPRQIDGLERRIELLREASHRVRMVRRLFSDMISSLPDATLLADAAGRIVLANPAAVEMFGLTDCQQIEETEVDVQLFGRVRVEALRFSTLAANAPSTVEAVLEDAGRHVLVRTVPFFDAAQSRIGTIIALADITALRAVQRERDEVLRFLSHDMKSPASSLLGLAQLQRDPSRALPAPELSRRLDLLAQRMLTLVDGFVMLARAESADPRAFDTFDLRDAVQDAYDEVWATAQARNILVTSIAPEEPLLVLGDRQLLARAIVNVLGNAIKFSPPQASVSLTCAQQGQECVVKVADQGPGIEPEGQAALFQRFSRRMHRGTADPGGAGLGLAFVRVVAEKHRGRAWLQTGHERGAVFGLALPAANAGQAGAGGT